jgi:hypothetical protein
LAVEWFQNTLASKPRFKKDVRYDPPEPRLPAFFSGALCHIGRQRGFSYG